ncbi:MAG: hypothetical protein AAF652_15540 [Cyanobacteria bacterium P01_C01_bin.72]
MVKPTYSKITSEGGEEKQVMLLQCDRQERMSKSAFKAREFKKVSEEVFCKIWQANVLDAPELETSVFYLVSGLLLPIWNKLGGDKDSVKVWRLTTDSNHTLLGRVFNEAQMQSILDKLEPGDILSPSSVITIAQQGGKARIKDDLYLVQSRVNNIPRLEILGWNYKRIPEFQSYGCYEEIIKYNSRLFVPTDKSLEVIARLRTA